MKTIEGLTLEQQAVNFEASSDEELDLETKVFDTLDEAKKYCQAHESEMYEEMCGVYCEECGSCGEHGCCGNKCKYLKNHLEEIKSSLRDMIPVLGIDGIMLELAEYIKEGKINDNL